MPVPLFDAKAAPKGVALSLEITQGKRRTYNSSPPEAGFMGG